MNVAKRMELWIPGARSPVKTWENMTSSTGELGKGSFGSNALFEMVCSAFLCRYCLNVD